MMAHYGLHQLAYQKQCPAFKLQWIKSQNCLCNHYAIIFTLCCPQSLPPLLLHNTPLSYVSFLDLFLTCTSPSTNTSHTYIPVFPKISYCSKPFSWVMADMVLIIQSSAVSMKLSSCPNWNMVVSSMHLPPIVISNASTEYNMQQYA